MTTTPTSAPQVFGDWAYLAIEKHFQKTIKHEPDVIKDKDPEALHQMRVGMRRLRTAVTGFAPAILLPKAAKEQNIAKIARRLGELRDLDVLQDALENKYLPTLSKPEQKAGKKVLNKLQRQRQESLEQVQKTLHQERYQELKQAFKHWLDQPNYGIFAQLPIEDILPDLLLPLVSKFLLHPAWLLGVKLEAGEIEVKGDLNPEMVVELLNSEGDVLHSLRKQAKQVRYQMELFTDFYGSSYQEYLADIKSIQQILGHIQDSYVLAEFLSDALKAEMETELPTLAAQLRADRYQGWLEWRSLQQRYLDPKTRIDLHQTILKPVFTGE